MYFNYIRKQLVIVNVPCSISAYTGLHIARGYLESNLNDLSRHWNKNIDIKRLNSTLIGLIILSYLYLTCIFTAISGLGKKKNNAFGVYKTLSSFPKKLINILSLYVQYNLIIIKIIFYIICEKMKSCRSLFTICLLRVDEDFKEKCILYL